jgi:formiminotetrahydrofolate cyclodeaminase
MFENMSITEFTDKLSSEAPVPGGGGAAALSAALAASLTAMIFNLTVGKKMFEEYDEITRTHILESLNEAKNAKREFLTFIDKDAEAFSKIIVAYKLSKATEEEKKARSERIQEGYILAAKVPMELAKRASELYEIIEVACKYGNINVMSDAGAAAIFNHSVIETAVLNISINLSGIRNEKLKNDLKLTSAKLLTHSEKKKNMILKKVYQDILS